MKILHTADWHLGDRLGRIDRTMDLRRAVERVATYCKREKVDVLIVAGDLFSELSRADALRETIHHWQDVFTEFMANGGTILTCTGNHDNENFCQTLYHAMSLAAPMLGLPGERIHPGRFYLAADPTFLTLRDPRENFDVQFALMPYPTSTRYLKGEQGQKYVSPEEKNRLLVLAFEQALTEIGQHANYRRDVPSILAAHVHVFGANIGPNLFRMTEEEDILVNDKGMSERFAYVALGHIHKPQFLGGCENVRYSGSIEKMDLGEASDIKGVVLFEVGAKGLVGELNILPMPSTPIYEVAVMNPSEDIPRLRIDAEDSTEDLVNLHIRYKAGDDHLEEILRDLDRIYPRWYARDWVETTKLSPTLVPADAARNLSFGETVRDYVSVELTNHDEADKAAIVERLNQLIDEMP